MEQEYGKISITIRHVNRLRASWGISRNKGRPRHSDSSKDSCPQKNSVRVKPNLPFIGVSIFDDRMEQNEGFSGIMMLLKQAIEQYSLNNPGDSFPLLKHRDETVLFRFKGLFYAPLFGIGKLTEFDVTEHSLENIISRNYQSSTLNQYLGQMERIDASEFLMPALVSSAPEGEAAYIGRHMIPFRSKAVPMRKGKIT
ncbi:MAG: winged helix-turn-helix domain-containing protein, partial [bacterium]|nr:winged helix-turn-helix domain-containing protein [bacterium]